MSFKVLLVSPGNTIISEPRQTWIRSGVYEVVSIMRKAGADVIFWDEITQGHLRQVPEDLNLCCISGLTPSRIRANRLAEWFKICRYKVLAGGMDVTGLYNEQGEEDLLSHFDSIAPGRLTVSLCKRIFDDCKANSLQSVYIADPTDPYEWNIPAHDLVNPAMYLAPGSYRSSSGCQFNCGFCSVRLVCGNKPQCKPISILQKEFETLPKSRVYVDASDNVAADYDYFTTELLPFIESRKIRWMTEMSAAHLLANQEEGRQDLFAPLKKSGAIGIYFGVEDPYVKISGKSLPVERYEEVVRKLHENKMLAIGSFIFDIFDGKNAETEESIKRTVDWMIRTKFDIVQISLLSLLPGTAFREIAIKKVTNIDHNPEHYDGCWPTRQHPNLSPEKRIELMADAYKRFYSFGNILRRRTIGSPMIPYYLTNLFAHKCGARWRQSFDSAYWQRTRWETESGR